jgi:hypothetical protein
MADLSPKERRDFLRVDQSIPIACRRFTDESIIRTIDHSRNISPTGILFETDMETALGAMVEVTLFLAERKIKALGEVVRCEEISPGKWNIAVRFRKMDNESQDLLKQMVVDGSLTE